MSTTYGQNSYCSILSRKKIPNNISTIIILLRSILSANGQREEENQLIQMAQAAEIVGAIQQDSSTKR